MDRGALRDRGAKDPPGLNFTAKRRKTNGYKYPNKIRDDSVLCTHRTISHLFLWSLPVWVWIAFDVSSKLIVSFFGPVSGQRALTGWDRAKSCTERRLTLRA